MKLSHPFLCYKGVFDGIVTHNNQLVIFEIKTSDRIKNSLATSFDYPLQVAAYAGLINYDKSLDLKITNGLIMVCYPLKDQPATLLEVDFNNMKKYWRKWLKKLSQFWAYEDKNVGPKTQNIFGASRRVNEYNFIYTYTYLTRTRTSSLRTASSSHSLKEIRSGRKRKENMKT
uniref:PD-(D/E)XK endonuclease-like domain-containing protein n=1 Tax=Romanomermis culicivorax TaxID=13658 RepID=A0A915KPR3_ROMCU